MRFVAKRRNVSYEGCAFKHFGYETDDVDKIIKLKNSKFYNKGFIALEDTDKNIVTMTGSGLSDLDINELEKLIEKKKALLNGKSQKQLNRKELIHKAEEMGFSKEKGKSATISKTKELEEFIAK